MIRSVISSAMAVGSAVIRIGESFAPRRANGGDQLGVLEVGPDRVADARVLDLDHDLPAVGEVGGVDLADRRRRHRALADPGEHLVDGAAELALEDGAHGLEGHRRRVGLQRTDDLLVRRPVLLGDGAGVEEGQELADLHGHALHVAEHGDVALRLAGEPVELLLLVAGQLPGDAPEALPHGEPGEGKPSRQPPAPDAVPSHTASLCGWRPRQPNRRAEVVEEVAGGLDSAAPAEVAVPQDPSRRRPMGPPPLAERLEAARVRYGGEPERLGHRHLERAVAHRPQVGSTEAREEVDVGRPRPDAGQRDERTAHGVVVQALEGVQIQRSVLDRHGERAQVAVLLPGDPVGPQLVGAARQHRGGGDRADPVPQAPVRRRA